jgi:hypothetical protein
MGRPVRKDKLGGADKHTGSEFASALSGKIAVTAYRPFGGAKVDSRVAFIVNQRGSRKFKIHLEDSSEEVMLLRAVAPGSLANDNVNSMGEFCVQVILDDSTVAYVDRFFNNTVSYVTSGGVTGNAPYSLKAEGTDEGQDSGKANIDVR